MKFLQSLILLTSICLTTNILGQGVSPGCYCVEGTLRTVEAGEFLSSILAGPQYSGLPCLTAFGQEDGSSCEACLCTSRENDAGFLQIQSIPLFSGSAAAGYTSITCEDILENDDTLLLCGPCPIGQQGASCDAFMAPDTDTGSPEDSASIPTLGEWSLILLSLGLLICSVVALKQHKSITPQDL